MLKKKIYSVFKSLPKPLQIYIRWNYAVWYRDNYTHKYKNKIIKKWKSNGEPLPPPHVCKQQMIEHYRDKFKCNVLVETGTYLGEMVNAQKRNFNKIYSIELSKELFTLAKKRFKKYRHITIIHGDSGDKIKVVIDELKEPAIFWLDGHYSAGVTAMGSKECPIYKELDAIFNKHFKHIILIDDARCFTGKNDYPDVHSLTEYVLSKNKMYNVKVCNDIIQYYID